MSVTEPPVVNTYSEEPLDNKVDDEEAEEEGEEGKEVSIWKGHEFSIKSNTKKKKKNKRSEEVNTWKEAKVFYLMMSIGRLFRPEFYRHQIIQHFNYTSRNSVRLTSNLPSTTSIS